MSDSYHNKQRWGIHWIAAARNKRARLKAKSALKRHRWEAEALNRRHRHDARWDAW